MVSKFLPVSLRLLLRLLLFVFFQLLLELSDDAFRVFLEGLAAAAAADPVGLAVVADWNRAQPL